MGRVRIAVLIASASRAQQFSVVTEVAHVIDLIVVTDLAAPAAVVTKNSRGALPNLIIFSLYLCRTRRAIITLFPTRRAALKRLAFGNIRLVVVNEAIECLQRIGVGKSAVVVRKLFALGAVGQGDDRHARKVILVHLVACRR